MPTPPEPEHPAEPTASLPTVLLTFTGRDRPGVTALVFGTVARFEVEVLDLEQIVIRGRLVLGFLVSQPDDLTALHDAATKVAAELEMTLDVEPGLGDERTRGPECSHVTVLGRRLSAAAVADVAHRIAEVGANIDRIDRMARYPVTAIELHVSGADTATLRTLLAPLAREHGVDVAVQPANLMRRGMRLIVMDVDSTLIQGEVIEMLAAHVGLEAEVAEITERAMRGELDFAASLRARVALLEGLDATALDQVYAALVLSPGARTTIRTLKRLGYRFAMVSGGFSQIVEPLAADLGVDFSLANELEIVDGHLTGRVLGDVVDRAAKAEALRRFAAAAGLPDSATIAIGDGANDLDMLNAAGLGIAFNAKPVVQQAAHTSVNVPFFDTLLYLLGISREEVEEADQAYGFTTPTPPLP